MCIVKCHMWYLNRQILLQQLTQWLWSTWRLSEVFESLLSIHKRPSSLQTLIKPRFIPTATRTLNWDSIHISPSTFHLYISIAYTVHAQSPQHPDSNSAVYTPAPPAVHTCTARHTHLGCSRHTPAAAPSVYLCGVYTYAACHTDLRCALYTLVPHATRTCYSTQRVHICTLMPHTTQACTARYRNLCRTPHAHATLQHPACSRAAPTSA